MSKIAWLEKKLRMDLTGVHRFTRHKKLRGAMGRCDECGANCRHEPFNGYRCVRCGERTDPPFKVLSDAMHGDSNE